MTKGMWLSFLRWLSGGDPYLAMLEQHNMLIRLARRCAYDLRHAANFIPREHWSQKEFAERSEFWVELFQSGNSMKDYRLELHREIEQLEREVEQLRQGLVTEVGPF